MVGYEKGKGRNIGTVGALIVVNGMGIKFKCGSGLNDKDRDHPPKIGSKITYKYQNLSDSGKPRFPIFLRRFKET